MDLVVALRNVKKFYGSFLLSLEDFAVKRGTVHGLIGANGSGKTTTLKMLLGLIRADEGEVRVLGSDNIVVSVQLRQDIGFIIEDAALPSLLNAQELERVFRGIYQNWDQRVWDDLLEKFNLEKTKPYRKYSRGMKVKLQLAVALSHHATFLLLDEPTSGLDPLARNEILTILSEFSKDENHTILISSHITSDLEKLCDYITFLEQGRIRFTEEKDELLEMYRIVKTQHQKLSDFDEESIIAKRDGSFQVELLMKTKDVPLFALSERPNLDDLIVLLSRKGGSAC